MSQTETIQTPQDYVNYTFNIEARGVAEVSSELMGLSNTVGNILGQLAFKTSEFLSHTDTLAIGTGVAIGAMFASATKDAIHFQQQIANVQAIGGEAINAQSIGDAAMEYSNKFGMATASMTEGLEALARAGITSTNVMKEVLAEGVKLSKLEGLDLEDSINDLISTTNLLSEAGVDMNDANYGKLVQDMNQHIVSTSESAPINAQNIIQTLQHVGGYASASGMDQEDLFAVIAQLGSRGTKGEMAGTALRAFIAAGQKDTAQRALARIGLNVGDLWSDSGETMLPISEMKQVLDDALEARGYSKQEKLEFYSDFAGYKQANQIMKIDTSEVQKYKEDIANAWDLGKKLDVILGTVRGNLDRIWQITQNFMTKVGSQLLTVMNAILTPVRILLDIFTKIPFADTAVAAGMIFVGFRTGLMIFNKIVPVLTGFVTGISNAKSETKGFRGEWEKTRDAIKEAKDTLHLIKVGDRESLVNKAVDEHQLIGRNREEVIDMLAGQYYMKSSLYDEYHKQPWQELPSAQKFLIKLQLQGKEDFKQNYDETLQRMKDDAQKVSDVKLDLTKKEDIDQLEAVNVWLRNIYDLLKGERTVGTDDTPVSNRESNRQANYISKIMSQYGITSSKYGDYTFKYDNEEDISKLKENTNATIKRIEKQVKDFDNTDFSKIGAAQRELYRKQLFKSDAENQARKDYSLDSHESEVRFALEHGRVTDASKWYSDTYRTQLAQMGDALGMVTTGIDRATSEELDRFVADMSAAIQALGNSKEKIDEIASITRESWDTHLDTTNFSFLKRNQGMAQDIANALSIDTNQHDTVADAVISFFGQDNNQTNANINKAIEIMFSYSNSEQGKMGSLEQESLRFTLDKLQRERNTFQSFINQDMYNESREEMSRIIEQLDANNTLFREGGTKLGAALTKGFIEDGMGIHSPGYIYKALYAELDAVKFLLSEFDVSDYANDILSDFNPKQFAIDNTKYSLKPGELQKADLNNQNAVKWSVANTVRPVTDYVNPYAEALNKRARRSGFTIPNSYIDKALARPSSDKYKGSRPKRFLQFLDETNSKLNDSIWNKSLDLNKNTVFYRGGYLPKFNDNGIGFFDSVTSTTYNKGIGDSYADEHGGLLSIYAPHNVKSLLAGGNITRYKEYYPYEQERMFGYGQPIMQVGDAYDYKTSTGEVVDAADMIALSPQNVLGMKIAIENEITDINDILKSKFPELEESSYLLAHNMTDSFIHDGLGRHSPGYWANAIKDEVDDVDKALDDGVENISKHFDKILSPDEQAKLFLLKDEIAKGRQPKSALKDFEKEVYDGLQVTKKWKDYVESGKEDADNFRLAYNPVPIFNDPKNSANPFLLMNQEHQKERYDTNPRLYTEGKKAYYKHYPEEATKLFGPLPKNHFEQYNDLLKDAPTINSHKYMDNLRKNNKSDSYKDFLNLKDAVQDEIDDVDDVIDNKSNKLEESSFSLAKRMTKRFIEDGLGRHSPGDWYKAVDEETLDVMDLIDNRSDKIGDMIRSFLGDNRESLINELQTMDGLVTGLGEKKVRIQGEDGKNRFQSYDAVIDDLMTQALFNLEDKWKGDRFTAGDILMGNAPEGADLNDALDEKDILEFYQSLSSDDILNEIQQMTIGNISNRTQAIEIVKRIKEQILENFIQNQDNFIQLDEDSLGAVYEQGMEGPSFPMFNLNADRKALELYDSTWGRILFNYEGNKILRSDFSEAHPDMLLEDVPGVYGTIPDELKGKTIEEATTMLNDAMRFGSAGIPLDMIAKRAGHLNTDEETGIGVLAGTTSVAYTDDMAEGYDGYSVTGRKHMIEIYAPMGTKGFNFDDRPEYTLPANTAYIELSRGIDEWGNKVAKILLLTEEQMAAIGFNRKNAEGNYIVDAEKSIFQQLFNPQNVDSDYSVNQQQADWLKYIDELTMTITDAGRADMKFMEFLNSTLPTLIESSLHQGFVESRDVFNIIREVIPDVQSYEQMMTLLGYGTQNLHDDGGRFYEEDAWNNIMGSALNEIYNSHYARKEAKRQQKEQEELINARTQADIENSTQYTEDIEAQNPMFTSMSDYYNYISNNKYGRARSRVQSQTGLLGRDVFLKGIDIAEKADYKIRKHTGAWYEQSQQYAQKHGNNNLEWASEQMKDVISTTKQFSNALSSLSDIFPILTPAVMALDTALQIQEAVSWGLKAATDVLTFAKTGETQSTFLQTMANWANSESALQAAAGQMVLTSVTWLASAAEAVLAFIRGLSKGTLLVLAAAILVVIAAIEAVKFWENKHAEALKESQKALEEATAKNNVALSQYKDLKKARENETDAIKKQQVARKEAIALYELEAARINKRKAVQDEAKIRNDAVWGEYGLRASLQKMGLGFIAGGDFQSQYENYDGTTANIRQIKEGTLGNLFASSEQRYVASVYDKNSAFFAEVEAYKEPLQELYDKESQLIEQYGSIDLARGTKEFEDAVQEFADATGINGETAVKMLEWLETENKVNQATKVGQAQIGVIRARADAKVAGLEYGEGGDLNDMDNLGNAMVMAQFQEMMNTAKTEVWWELLYAYLDTFISILLPWKWGEVGKNLATVGIRQEELAELDAEGNNILSSMYDAYENADRRDYGSGVSYYADTPFGGALDSAAVMYADDAQQQYFAQTGSAMTEDDYQAIKSQYQEDAFGVTNEGLKQQKAKEDIEAYEKAKEEKEKNKATDTLGQLQNNGEQAHEDALDIIDAIKGKGGIISGLGSGILSLSKGDFISDFIHEKGLSDIFKHMAGEEGTITGAILSKGKGLYGSLMNRVAGAREINAWSEGLGVDLGRSGFDKAVGIFDNIKGGRAGQFLSKGASKLGGLTKGLSNSGVLRTVGKVGGRALQFLGPAIAFAEGVSTHNPFETHYNADGTEKKALQSTGEVLGSTAGALGGVAGGAMGASEGAALGAAVGTLLLPGIGTAIGGAIGAVGGGIIGGWLGDTIFQPIGEAIGGTVGWLGDNLLGGIQSAAGTIWDGLTGAAGSVWDFVTNGGVLGMGINAASGIFDWLTGGNNDPYKNIEKATGQKMPPTTKSENTVIIKNININTEDDPEKIKSALMNLIIEMQEQISPRQVSRTVGEPPAQSTSTTQDENNTPEAEGTDPQSGAQNGDQNNNPTT